MVVQKNRGYMLVRRGLDGPTAPIHEVVRRGQIVDGTGAKNLKRCRLAIVVPIVSGLVSRSVGKMASICHESRTSLCDCCERMLK